LAVGIVSPADNSVATALPQSYDDFTSLFRHAPLRHPLWPIDHCGHRHLFSLSFEKSKNQRAGSSVHLALSLRRKKSLGFKNYQQVLAEKSGQSGGRSSSWSAESPPTGQG